MAGASPILKQILEDRELRDELFDLGRQAVTPHRATLEAASLEVRAKDITSTLEGKPDAAAPGSRMAAEAIVLITGRPSLLIHDGTFENPQTGYWSTRLEPCRSVLEKVIRSVGRIELQGHDTYEWVGTGWMVSPTLIATNRHVASVFAARRGDRFVFRRNAAGTGDLGVQIDFLEEYGSQGTAEFSVSGVRFISPDQEGQPDIAILEVRQTGGFPAALPLAQSSSRGVAHVAVIGYPAYDTRNDRDAMQNIFRGIFDKKRLAPGKLMSSRDPATLMHDCSTLGGNSGSAVVNISTGEVVGLHFGGRFGQANYAVRAEAIRAVIARVQPSAISVGVPGLPEAPTASELQNRKGYLADFLGNGRRVRLPVLSNAQEEDAVEVPGRVDFVLPYQHFSVVMCKSRRLCYFTAVNIDGNQSVNLRRTGNWFLDPRIPADAQSGNELYAGNNFDRGHMVRRLDPVWGSAAIAKVANNDTFSFTNSCPQIASLNQGIWNDLEDYVLNNADERNLKVSVFTGPVFRDDDPIYRNTRIPRDFWKVVVMVRTDGKLSATAYMLSQRQLLGDLEEAPEFVFGRYRTYQVKVAHVESLTELSFGNLRTFDPIGDREGIAAGHVLETPEDIVLG